MPAPTIPFTFISGTLAKSSEVNSNFTALRDWLIANAIQKDGSLAFTAVPSGPALDPSSDNQLARKRYVDRVQQAGSVGYTLSGTNADSGSVVFPTAFLAAPTVLCQPRVGGNFDHAVNLTAAPTTTGFSWRVFTNSGNTQSVSGTLYWVAFGRY